MLIIERAFKDSFDVTNILNNINRLFMDCRKVHDSPLLVLIRYFFFRLRSKNILSSNKTTIYGLKNISTSGLLRIGLGYVGFMSSHDRTFLNIQGKAHFKDNYLIGKGCRFDIGENAIAEFGRGYVNPNSVFVIMHGIHVGDGCAISWGCQFIDEDFHKIDYLGHTRKKDNIIKIGTHVWIGSNVVVLKGSIIPDGCVVASGSVVCATFEEKNTLIAGNPAKVVRKNIRWE